MPAFALGLILAIGSLTGSQAVIAANVNAANDWNSPGHVESFQNSSLHNVETQLGQ